MRYSPGRSYSLALHSDAEDDLERIYVEDEDVGADIEAFLEEAKNNQETLDNLTRRGHVEYGEWPYSVDEWQETKNSRYKYNLWRLKLMWLTGTAAKYRVVYAFHPVEFRYYILGIVTRDFKYDPNHERSKKIFTAYDALNIPRY
ncbi:MAG: hypothetical protein KKH12_13985 [Gammaproteobacteria bacterium]|nr:hypothetical protein [Gammaproteobacteria bacterium]MBU1482770.1 hypothetical protein [Gammaproteobacteria bacterium]